MAEYPALPLFTDAFLADTAHLSDEELGIYTRLLILMWRTPGCSIPNDNVWIARRLKTNEVTLKAVMDEFCKLENGGQRLTQKRLKKEFQYLINQSKKQRERALKKWTVLDEKKPEKKQTDFSSSLDNSLKNKETDISRNDAPHPTPPIKKKEDTNVSSKEAPKGSKNLSLPDPDFETFWNAFPKTRAGSKEKAFAVWKKALTKTTPKEIIDATIAYARSDEIIRGYAKGAAAWLNDDRWTTDYSSTPAARQGNGYSPLRAMELAMAELERYPKKGSSDERRETDIEGTCSPAHLEDAPAFPEPTDGS